MSLRIALIGAKGRMGQAITAAAKEAGATISAAIDAGDDMAAGISTCDVIIDFSFHKITPEVIRLAALHNKPLVIGTTGHPADEKKHLLVEAAKIPCVWSGNYSVGVNLLFALTRRAASVLGSDYDAEVIEMHHRFKKDAPSGTAARLLEIILEERKLDASALRHGREGITGERTVLPPELVDNVGWLRTQTELPICIGFGISQPEHVRLLAPVADGLIVGSAIVRRIATAAEKPRDQVLREVGEYVAELLAALR